VRGSALDNETALDIPPGTANLKPTRVATPAPQGSELGLLPAPGSVDLFPRSLPVPPFGEPRDAPKSLEKRWNESALACMVKVSQ